MNMKLDYYTSVFKLFKPSDQSFDISDVFEMSKVTKGVFEEITKLTNFYEKCGRDFVQV